MKKTKILSLLLVFLLVFSVGLTGCSPVSEEPVQSADSSSDSSTEKAVEAEEPAASELPEITMTIAHGDPPDAEKHTQGASLAFKEYVEAESGGKIQVEISAGGALGKNIELQEQVQNGVIEACTSIAEGTLAAVYPDIQMMTVPYLFKTVDSAIDILRGDIGDELYEGLREQTGIRVVSIWDNGGFRCFTNNVRPIKTPADLEGIKIRTMEIPAHMTMVEAMGGSPTPISWSELYSALQTNVVDGQENPLPILLVGSLYEVQKYLTLDNHVYTSQHLIVNDEWFEGLPQEYQKIILDAGKIAGNKGAEINAKSRETALDFLADYMEIYQPTDEELDMFKDACQDEVLDFVRDEVQNQDLFDRLLEAASN